MSALRLDLIVRQYPDTPTGKVTVDMSGRVDRWTWRLWSGSRIVSTSGSQRYSRRIDCARGAEVGAGLCYVANHLRKPEMVTAYRHGHDNSGQQIEVRILDEREATR